MQKIKTERIVEAAKKAQKLIGELTLTEKVGQLTQYGTSIYNDKPFYNTQLFPEGKLGSYLSITGAELINSLQKECLENEPTYIPLLFAQDVIHGYKTIMPTPLAQSCSWQPEAARKGAEVAAKEAYSAGIRWTFSPMVDIARDPRWGRIVEGYGEDSYLCSRFAEKTVEGYQGDLDGEDKILACMKHFVGYGAGYGGRDYEAVDMSLQTLYDVYLPPFKAGIDAGAATVMCAFHSFNGVPCSSNKMLLDKVLRNDLGFEGFVVSDAGSVHELKVHGQSPDYNDAVLRALRAGVNMLMAGDIYNVEVPKLIESGELTEQRIDQMLLPILTYKYLLNLFEKPYTDEAKQACLLCDEHRAVSREIAKECVVMLENDGILPLCKNKKVSIIGPLGDNNNDILGPWSLDKIPDTTVTIKQGFINAGYKVEYAKGCEIDSSNAELLSEAVKVAKSSDIILLALGEAENMSGEAKSRSSLHLPKAQIELFNELAKTDKPIVLLISAGRPIIVEEFKNRANAIVYVWQLGTEAGNAIADVISGECDVTGRLSVSVPFSEGQLPVFYNRTNTGRPALGKVWYETGYIDSTAHASYPFGYGKSYTDFNYSDLTLSSNEMGVDGEITVSLKIKNVGSRKGSTVAQLYIRDLFASRVRPIMELKGFEKLELEAGEEKLVSLKLAANSLGFHDEELNYIVEKGDFKLWVGENCRDQRLITDFKIC